MRRMHPEMREVEEERFVFVACDEIHRFVGEEVGEVLALWRIGLRIRGEIEVDARAHDRFVEAALAGKKLAPFANVPFPKHPRRVTASLELLGDDVAVERQLGDVVHGPQRTRTPVKPADTSDGVNASARAVLPAQQSRASGRAILTMVMAEELHALRRESVNIRRLVVFAAVGRGVRPPEIIGHDEDDVWLGVSVKCDQRCEKQSGECEERLFHSAECGAGYGHLNPVCLWSFRMSSEARRPMRRGGRRCWASIIIGSGTT